MWSEIDTGEPTIWMPDRRGKELRRWRVPNIIASDLLGFRARPLWQNQQCKEARQDSRVDRGEAASFTEQAMYNWVSSAYCCSDTLYCEAMSAIGEIQRQNRIGPRTDPWGTPVRQSVTVGVEEALSTQTLWVLPNKYEVSHANGEPVMPNLVCNLFNRILWSMVSNAALKSKDTNIVHLPLSEARYICRSTSYTEPSQKSASFYKLTEAGYNKEN